MCSTSALITALNNLRNIQTTQNAPIFRWQQNYIWYQQSCRKILSFGCLKTVFLSCYSRSLNNLYPQLILKALPKFNLLCLPMSISTYRFHSTITPRGECDNCCEIREAADIKFHLYNEKYQKNGKQIFLNDAKGLKNLNKNLPLEIFVHGFTDSSIGPSTLSAMMIKDAFMEVGNHSVILVDWSPISAFPWYMEAVKSAPRVARYLARFIKFLLKSGVLLENIHLIGFSLGAEVSGFTGKTLKDWGILLPRITGIDPAGPLFMNGDTTTHISRSDAKFVDIIHTDGGILGMPWAVGHADFFPNGGVASQPGCINEGLSRNNLMGIVAGCSHTRALLFFAESIKHPKAFPSERCDPISNESVECKEDIPAYMGQAADKRLRGKFYLTTNSEEPFGKGY